ncbi:unnamed protein product [Mytilus coruscus]|uniref:Tyr recombinase domain-containing protein n=1 Tax=Mytilus coruscus TaxID=42192 RepID=A0A6J8DSE0_MYTCO|nr:unnamed protein product [Mytilus coruscus]
MGILPTKGNNSNIRIHSGGSKRDCGLGKPSHRKFKQLDFEQSNILTDQQNNGFVEIRSVRRSPKRTIGQLCQLATRSIRNLNRCVSGELVEQEPICFSPVLLDSSLPSESEQRTLESSNHNSSLAVASVLPNAIGNVNINTKIVPTNEGFTEESVGREPPTNRKQNLKTSGVESFRTERESGETLPNSWLSDGGKGPNPLTTAAGDTGIAGVVNGTWIPFRPLWNLKQTLLHICFSLATSIARYIFTDFIDKTVSFRINECNQLLNSFIKPHRPVKSCTIAHWLKRILESAGIDHDIFKPHSTRGASTSRVSIKQIMNTANWRSRGTFEKFYHKPLETEIEADDEELNMSIEDLDRRMGSLSVGCQMDRDEGSSQMNTSENQLNGTLTIPTDEENTVEHNIFMHIEDMNISCLENLEDS